MTKKIILLTTVTLALFALSFINHTNNVSGAFVGIRRFGWPTHPVSVSKVSENITDVEIVMTKSTDSLLKNGWTLDYDIAKLILNFIVFLIISGLLTTGLSITKRRNKS